MKKFFLTFAVLTFTLCAFAQNFGALTLFYSTNKMEDAKTEIDKISADPKKSQRQARKTALWKKFKVYAELFADSNLIKKYPDAGNIAYQALMDYVSKDNTLKMIKSDDPAQNGLRGLSLLYNQSFNYGRSAFNTKDWQSSYDNFSFCQKMSEFIGNKGLNSNGKYTIDTTVVLYAAYAAQNSGKVDSAAVRYKMLADYKIGGKENEDNYKFILDYDTKKKNEASFKKYLAIAQELYPADKDLWAQFDNNYLTSNASLDELLENYKKESQSGAMTEDRYIGYAEAFASPGKDAASMDSAKQIMLKQTAADAYEKAFYAGGATNGLYAFNVGVLNYNIFGILDDRFNSLRGETAALKAQRDAVTKLQMPYADTSVFWLEKSYTILKSKNRPRQK